MNAMLHGMARAARQRVVSGHVLAGSGIATACAAVAWRAWGIPAMVAVVAVAVAGCVAVAWRRARRHDAAWVASRLDATRRDLDDSTGLLLAPPGSLGPLQELQRARLEQRLRERPPGDLRPAWPWRAIAAAWCVAAVVVAWALLWPQAAPTAPTKTDGVAAVPPELVAARLRIDPPAYTGIAAGEGTELDVQAPAGSRLRWTLRFEPQPAAVALVLHDGGRIDLRREGGDWVAETRLQASMLYRVVAEGEAAQGRLHRIDAVPDAPPRVRVRIPERGLVLADPPPRAWTLSFEAEDDHGLQPEARLLVTRTEGTGENIRFHEHVLVLRGRGDRRALRFDASLDPAAYGLQRGEDLVARLEVRDNRMPEAQATRSASVILRWPEQTVMGAEGLEGLARQVLPAYFRSQRQIIIDAEALIAEKPRLSAEAFAARSDSLGVDQRLLRLRYGQFLGEESEGTPRPPPTSDLPVDDAGEGHDDGDGHAHDDGHDHGGAGPDSAAETKGFGNPAGLLEAFGHTHDLPEAATLLDPKTKEILRKALREMWQSELHLRQAAPEQALPYAYRALEFIKQVQQADRIYLQRVGTRLPPIDETRRLSGKRDGIAPRAPAPPRRADDGVLPAAWQALDGEGPVTAETLDAVLAWAGRNATRAGDPLALAAAVDALRLDPACRACRDDLRGLLWAAMRRPDGGVAPRADGGEPGRRYLELLQRGEAGP